MKINIGGNLMLHTNEKIIKNKVGLLNLAEELGNVVLSIYPESVEQATYIRVSRTVGVILPFYSLQGFLKQNVKRRSNKDLVIMTGGK